MTSPKLHAHVANSDTITALGLRLRRPDQAQYDPWQYGTPRLMLAMPPRSAICMEPLEYIARRPPLTRLYPSRAFHVVGPDMVIFGDIFAGKGISRWVDVYVASSFVVAEDNSGRHALEARQGRSCCAREAELGTWLKSCEDVYQTLIGYLLIGGTGLVAAMLMKIERSRRQRRAGDRAGGRGRR